MIEVYGKYTPLSFVQLVLFLTLLMAKPQTVTGFFDNTAEAQQAVQALLKIGFTAEHITFSTQKRISKVDKPEAPTPTERNTGRFLTSLFGTTHQAGSTMPGGGEPDGTASPNSATSVTVQIQLLAEVDQVVDVLKGARLVRISQPEA